MVTDERTHLLPEPEAVHLLVVVAEGRVGQRRPLEIHVVQLRHVRTNDLVRVHEYDLHRDCFCQSGDRRNIFVPTSESIHDQSNFSNKKCERM